MPAKQIPVFRTPTGQTGHDAYVYEAAQIANAQRELDNRFRDLRATIARENPDEFKNSTDFKWCGAAKAGNLRDYLLRLGIYADMDNPKNDWMVG